MPRARHAQHCQPHCRLRDSSARQRTVSTIIPVSNPLTRLSKFNAFDQRGRYLSIEDLATQSRTRTRYCSLCRDRLRVLTEHGKLTVRWRQWTPPNFFLHVRTNRSTPSAKVGCSSALYKHVPTLSVEGWSHVRKEVTFSSNSKKYSRAYLGTVVPKYENTTIRKGACGWIVATAQPRSPPMTSSYISNSVILCMRAHVRVRTPVL